MIKPALRKSFDRLFSLLPSSIHSGLLKSYANQPELTLKSGFRCYPQSFYSPLVNPAEVNMERLEGSRTLPGIQFDHDRIFSLLDELRDHCAELDWMERHPDGKVKWHETYTTLDSAVLYTLIRRLKPKRFIEVGCGRSSRVTSEAIFRNRSEGHDCNVTFIEPYPGPRLEGVKLAGELLVQKIEDTPLEYFADLGPGDILFIDTSHVIKCQNDVEYELLHILPSLKPGVFVHIHDIYTPYDQPKDWLLGRYAPGASNEQYAFECLLSGGATYQTVLPLYWLGKDHPEKVADFLGKAQDRGQAYWVEKV